LSGEKKLAFLLLNELPSSTNRKGKNGSDNKEELLFIIDVCVILDCFSKGMLKQYRRMYKTSE
jgi:hypothetical protein